MVLVRRDWVMIGLLRVRRRSLGRVLGRMGILRRRVRGLRPVDGLLVLRLLVVWVLAIEGRARDVMLRHVRHGARVVALLRRRAVVEWAIVERDVVIVFQRLCFRHGCENALYFPRVAASVATFGSRAKDDRATCALDVGHDGVLEVAHEG